MADQIVDVWKPSVVELQRENQALTIENRQLRERIVHLERQLKIDSEAVQMINDTLSSMQKVLVDAKEQSERKFT